MISVDHLVKKFILAKPYLIYPSTFVHQEYPTITAINDISFSVGSGEVLGIIGPNGAGKSTLLKILSGISKPSSGHIEIQGKCFAILELSTGFNPYLTGRENIRHRLTLQGYRKDFIRSVEPDIIEFCELSEVIDDKVQTYSTGMAARLAFAIVTASDAEVLLIDEILAVGDEYFQGKCFRRMKEICKSGRTVLMVSHSINYVERLCDSAIWLDHGKIFMKGPSHDVCMAYYGQNAHNNKNLLAREYVLFDTKIEVQDELYVIKALVQRLKPTSDLYFGAQIHDNDYGIFSHHINPGIEGAPPIPEGTGPIWVKITVHRNVGLNRGLVGVGLIRGSGHMPGSIIEDSRGTDCGNSLYFTVPRGSEPKNGYIGIPLDWHRCISK